MQYFLRWFLYKQMDVCKKSIGNVEDEVLTVFKKSIYLGYDAAIFILLRLSC